MTDRKINLKDGKKHVILMFDSGLEDPDFMNQTATSLHEALSFNSKLADKFTFHGCAYKDTCTFSMGKTNLTVPNFVSSSYEDDHIFINHLVKNVDQVSRVFPNEAERPIFLFLTKRPLLVHRANNPQQAFQPWGHSYFNTYSIVSTSFWGKGEDFKTLLLHEFGHVLGAEKDRTDTVENLGAHCSCPDCVMQQKGMGELSQKRRERQRSQKSPYCDDCCRSIIKHAVHITGQTKEELLSSTRGRSSLRSPVQTRLTNGAHSSNSSIQKRMDKTGEK